jgi:hypothetical protein
MKAMTECFLVMISAFFWSVVLMIAGVFEIGVIIADDFAAEFLSKLHLQVRPLSETQTLP